MKENTLEAKRQSPPRASRREFIQTTVVGAAAVALGVDLLAQTTEAQVTGIPTRPLGKTGQRIANVTMRARYEI